MYGLLDLCGTKGEKTFLATRRNTEIEYGLLWTKIFFLVINICFPDSRVEIHFSYSAQLFIVLYKIISIKGCEDHLLIPEQLFFLNITFSLSSTSIETKLSIPRYRY